MNVFIVNLTIYVQANCTDSNKHKQEPNQKLKKKKITTRNRQSSAFNSGMFFTVSSHNLKKKKNNIVGNNVITWLPVIGALK